MGGSYPVYVERQLRTVNERLLMQYNRPYLFYSGFDISCNALEGYIPEEIGLLKGLMILNLSHNRFSGIIPRGIGGISGLESLDLSFNELTGQIPQSLVSMDSLGYLNLSGQIPRGPHFDTLSGDGSAYANNSFLCGFPTANICDGEQKSNINDTTSTQSYQDDQEDAKQKLLLCAIVALGFVVGFWGLFIVLFIRKEKWWFPYWRFVDSAALGIIGFIQINNVIRSI
ncbi:receptor-like protein 35 [Papaver somniferum]|uniref:receptor-like protein 35 n=1 Tax=Papaver somniferum TaxID=3469 RepID=UPI000E705352|nr:receptor-like protein 35 [Papaver somniferum]